MRHAGEDRHRWRLRAIIVVLWRAGLRVHEALAPQIVTEIMRPGFASNK